MTKSKIDSILATNIPQRWNKDKSLVISTTNGTIEIMSRAACEGLAMMVQETKANRNALAIFILACYISQDYPQHIKVNFR